jgi:organic radical activating enzyme
MQNPIPKTFCPAKWDDLVVHMQQNYVYGCCKAAPIIFEKDYKSIIQNQRQNLLDGVQDPSCNYCWSVENNNLPSLRQEYLEKFDKNKFTEYLNVNRSTKNLEINLGNSCNMQCIYCNPRLSSQWENDVKQKKYPVFTDRFVYEISEKKDINETMRLNLEIIEKEQPDKITIIGGEPLLNKHFWKIASKLNNTFLSITTNLNCEIDVIKRLIELENENNLQLDVMASLDCTFPLSTFNRYNLDYDKFLNNLLYFIKNSKACRIGIQSLMTCITILDIENFLNFLKSLQEKFPMTELFFNFHVCTEPKIQSFSVMPDKTKDEILFYMKNYKHEVKVNGFQNIISYLQSSKFNSGLHKQFKRFIEEWESRKEMYLPLEVKEKLCI